MLHIPTTKNMIFAAAIALAVASSAMLPLNSLFTSAYASHRSHLRSSTDISQNAFSANICSNGEGSQVGLGNGSSIGAIQLCHAATSNDAAVSSSGSDASIKTHIVQNATAINQCANLKNSVFIGLPVSHGLFEQICDSSAANKDVTSVKP